MPQAQTTDWETPRDLFDQLDREFGPFTLDPCGQKEKHYSAHEIYIRGGKFYDGSCPALDGLAQRANAICHAAAYSLSRAEHPALAEPLTACVRWRYPSKLREV